MRNKSIKSIHTFKMLTTATAHFFMHISGKFKFYMDMIITMRKWWKWVNFRKLLMVRIWLSGFVAINGGYILYTLLNFNNLLIQLQMNILVYKWLKESEFFCKYWYSCDIAFERKIRTTMYYHNLLLKLTLMLYQLHARFGLSCLLWNWNFEKYIFKQKLFHIFESK